MTIKDRLVLIEVDFLTVFTNSREGLIRAVIKELHKLVVNEDQSIYNINDETVDYQGTK